MMTQEEFSIQTADWIWCNDTPEANNQHGLFRYNCDLGSVPASAHIEICADARYWLYVNGVRLGFGPARHHLPEPFFDHYDLQPWLCRGRNVIAIHVHGLGKVFRCSSFMTVRCGLVAAVELDEVVSRTGSDWKSYHERAYSANTPRHSNHQSYVDCLDGRAAVGGWNQVDFDDRVWLPATVLGKTGNLSPWTGLRPRPVAYLTLESRFPVRVIEAGRLLPMAELDPDDMATQAQMLATAERVPDVNAVTWTLVNSLWPMLFKMDEARASAYAIYDFGIISSGYVSLKISGEAGTVVDIGYAETIVSGQLDIYQQKVRYADRVILGMEPVEYQTVAPKCLRYLMVAVRGRAQLEQVSHDVSSYPFRWHGNFHSSDTVLDAAWMIGTHTVQIASEDIFMDTPRRERAGWLGDMRVEALAAYQAFGDTALARHCLNLYFQSQDMPGRFLNNGTDHPGWVVARYPSLDGPRTPDYNASLASIVHEYLLHSGEIEWTREVWPKLCRVTAHLESYRRIDDLICWEPFEHGGSEYLLIDWAPFSRLQPSAALNMMHALYLQDAMAIALRLGEQSTADELDGLRLRTIEAIRKNFWNSDRGIFVNGIQSPRAGYQENLLALLGSIATPPQRKSIERKLLSPGQALPVWNPESAPELDEVLFHREEPEWNDAEVVPIGSPYFTFVALGALFESGYGQIAIATIRTQYGQCLAQGATSTWEEWNGTKTHSHGWGAAPTALLARYVAGITPVEPGFVQFEILPVLADLKQASARVPTPHGVIQVEWSCCKEKICLRAIIPAGTTALVGLPMAQGPLTINGEQVSPKRIVRGRGTYHGVTLKEGTYLLMADGEDELSQRSFGSKNPPDA